MLGAVLVASPAQAAGPWYVAPSGNNAASCLSAAAPCATVTGALAKGTFAAGDTINVAPGTYADRPYVTKAARIVGTGPGVTFVGSTSTTAGWAMAAVLTGTLELQNLTLTAGNYQSGGALPIVSGNVRTTDVSITNSRSAIGGGAYLWPSAAATLTMTRGEVSGNRATAPAPNTGWGGGFYVSAGSSLTLDGVTVRNNTADGAGKALGLGGAILNVGSTTVRNSVIRNNEATAPAGASIGGAIYHNGTNLTLSDSVFRANTAAVGGALANNQPATGTNLVFDANTALAAGAVYPTANLTLTGGSLTSNRATTNYGGAIYAAATASVPVALSVTDVDLTGNSAPTSGGALYATANVTTTVLESLIADNTSQSGAGVYSSGAITVRDSEISDNAASYQGGGLTNGSTALADAPVATIIDTVVADNSAVIGGGLQNLTKGTLTVTGGRIEQNSAAGGGGVILGDNSTGTISRAVITGNIATSVGGAGVFNSGKLSVDRTLLDANQALTTNGLGGAIYSGSSTANVATTLDIDASTLSNNNAYGGSALLVHSTGTGATNTTTIARSTISGNTSSSVYGAIEQVGRPVTITNSTITDNSAASGGAGAIAAGAPSGGGVSGTVFAGNTPRACTGPVINNGGNHAGPGNLGCGVAPSADPELGVLGDNGGPTPTRLPSASSPLLDRLTCGAGTDQRGASRPQGAQCDIGAVERAQVIPTASGPAHVDLVVGSQADPAATVTTTGSPRPSLSATNLPSGLTFSDNGDGTGTLAGTPAVGTGGVRVVTVTATNEAGSGTTQIEVEIVEAPRLSGPTSSTYTVGTPGGPDVFTQVGGHPVATLSRAGLLPGGVGFTDNGNGTGTVAGTPAPASGGTYDITVKGSNGTGPDATWPFALTVNEAPSVDSPASASVRVGTPASIDLTVGGFPAPVITANGLPAGLTVNGTAVTGTPQPGTGGVHQVTFGATNGIGQDASDTTTLTVEEAASVAGPAAVRLVTGLSASVTYAATGFPVATLSVIGALPSGVTFVDNGDGTATLTGTPASGAVGSYAVTVRASNGVGTASELAVGIEVVAPVEITTTTLPAASIGAAYNVPLSITGGSAPYTFSLASGQLPTGLSLTSDGRITGTPNGTPVSATFTVKVTDGSTSNSTDTQQLTLVVGKGATTLVGGPVVILGNVLLGGELTAVLTGGTGSPIAGATVTFRGTNALLGDPLLCTATTDANGLARCKPSLVAIAQILLLVPSVKIAYAGSAQWLPSSTVVVKKLG
ncbi:hypothetical protein ASE01_22365 [Nocardioides sp. Root190]|nr:hypothetical protein ASE01_22365 [Nocardioides sp. Root190]